MFLNVWERKREKDRLRLRMMMMIDMYLYCLIKWFFLLKLYIKWLLFNLFKLLVILLCCLYWFIK